MSGLLGVDIILQLQESPPAALKAVLQCIPASERCGTGGERKITSLIQIGMERLFHCHTCTAALDANTMRIALVVLVFVSSWTTVNAVNNCAWTKVLSNGETHHSFIRTDKRKPQQRLYHSVWSKERALLKCAWIDDASVIHSYFILCKDNMTEFVGSPKKFQFDIDLMLATNGPCPAITFPTGHERRRADNRVSRSLREVMTSENRSHTRVKRGFIVPGTLWCGSGHKAPSYYDLGVFSDTDSCCREHDQCKDTIESFQSSFGVFNSNMFTMSHCDCDNRFRSCLNEAQDSISGVVGYTFFNILKMHCFEFSHKLQCTERNWFGMCKEQKMSVYAVVHPPTLYGSDVSDNDTAYSVSTVAHESTTFFSTMSELAEAATATPGLIQSWALGPSVYTTMDAKDTVRITSAPETSASQHNGLSTNNLNSLATTTKANVSNGSSVKQQETVNMSEQLSCSVYKDLDECRFKILPNKKRFGLLNPEPKTLYHCNCTSRLFQILSQQKEVTEMRTVLLEYISLSCFLKPVCTARKVCSAVIVEPSLPQLVLARDVEAEAGRHLQALKSIKIRRPNSKRAKQTDRAPRLNKLCVRMARHKINNTMNVNNNVDLNTLLT